jgi:DNA-binding NtrC family response regulator
MRFLIIESDKLIRWSMREILSEEGYIVDTANEIETATKLAKKHEYEVIFIDLDIDDSDPEDTLKRMSQLQPGSAVIALSVKKSQDLGKISNEWNIFKVIEKPFPLDEVKGSVQEALEWRTTLGKNK